MNAMQKEKEKHSKSPKPNERHLESEEEPPNRSNNGASPTTNPLGSWP
jgi:hypothetical protein